MYKMIIYNTNNVIGIANTKQKMGYLVDIIDFLINEGVDPYEILMGLEWREKNGVSTITFNNNGVLVGGGQLHDKVG